MSDVVKDNGRIYTPANIVKMMLDYAGYVPGPWIWKKHVIDNSCGDGRILCEGVGMLSLSGMNSGGRWIMCSAILLM